MAGQADAGQVSACFLCDSPARDTDAQTLILYRGQLAYVILNRYPYNTGHLLIAPYEHGAELDSLPPETSGEVWKLAQKCVAALRAEYHPDGFNIGMNLGAAAGAGVPDHMHLHVVPRWDGDTNFMPVLGDTKAMPEDLPQTFARLKPQFE